MPSSKGNPNQAIGIRISGLLVGLACCWAASAAPSARHTVRTWKTDDGLPENVVLALTQTKDGYLWLGTLKGLVRFDGFGRTSADGRTHFPVFDQNNTPELGSSTIVKVFEDSQTNLWIGTETAGVVLVTP